MTRALGVAPRWTLTVALAASAAMLAGCGSSKETTPTPTQPVITGKACTPASVSLAAMNSAIVECDTGTVVKLDGNGASYIIAAHLASGDSDPTRTTYTLSVNSGGSVVARIPPQTGGAAPAFLRAAGEAGAGRQRPGRFHQMFHQNLRALQHRVVARARASGSLMRARASVARPSLAVSCCPAVNSVRHFEVLSAETATSNTFKSVGARLSYVGTNLLLYIDTLAPQPGFSASQLQAFGQQFDQTLYPLDSIFGAPSDIDNNGHVIMLLSPVVNELTPKSQCANGFVGGFFFGNDLVNHDTTSNDGEVFYGLVPDSAGTVSCAHSVSDVQSLEGDIFLHELQHLINFGEHVLVTGGFEEEGWVDEGESIVAEEQGSLYYENKFPSPQGRTRNADPTTQLFPDSAEDYISGILDYMLLYLPRPDTTSATLHSDSDTDLPWRGSDWLLLRWLGDHYGNGFYKTLEHDVEVGTSNIAFAAQSPFQTVFANFAISLYTDSVPGQPRTAVPLLNRFTSRNLRQLNNRSFQIGNAAHPWLLPTYQLTATAASGSLLPGSIVFYRLDTSSQATVSVQFSGATAGEPIPRGFVPQLTIFRLPNP